MENMKFHETGNFAFDDRVLSIMDRRRPSVVPHLAKRLEAAPAALDGSGGHVESQVTRVFCEFELRAIPAIELDH